jgi:hypothetical protein
MTSRTRYHYVYAFMLIAAMTAAFLVGGLLGTRTTTQAAMHDVRIDIPAMMAATDSTMLPVLHIENPL